MFRKLLSRRGLSFDRLSALVDLADAGSLAKAADGDPNRQTLYSRQIKQLEDYFGVKLTRRRGHRLELTDAGRRLVDIVRESFLRLEDFQCDCERHPLTVTIAGGDSLLQWLVVPQLGGVRKSFPNVDIHLHDADTVGVVRELCELSVDLGVVRESALTPPLKSARLRQMTFSLFVPKTMVTSRPPLDALELLGTVPLALPATGGQFNSTFEAALRKQDRRCRVALHCISFIQAHRALVSGHYAAILPAFAAREVDASRFMELPLPFLNSYERIVCLAWNPRLLQLRPEVEKLAAQLVKCLAE